jgi:hypothetical protein
MDERRSQRRATWYSQPIYVADVYGRIGGIPCPPDELPLCEVVREDKIFDYLLVKPDGTREGNETGKLIEAREKAH